MAMELKNYDPALMYGANVGVSVDLTDITDMNGNEVIELDGVTSAVNYLRVTNAATTNSVTLSARGDDTNVGLTINSLLTGALTLDSTSTGAIDIGTSANAKTITIGNTTGATAVAIKSGTGGTIITSADDNGFTIGANGATNPVFKVLANTASVATGLSITGAAAASGLAVAVLSSGTDENLTIDAKGAGTIVLAGTSTGGITLTRATTASSSVLSTSATAGIGYGTGAGGTVTQLTNRTTGVTLNKTTGAITLVSAAGSATPATFTVTNSAVAATDTIVLNQKSGADLYHLLVTAVAAGSFNITAFTTGGTTTESPVINFAVLKGVAA